MKIMRSSPSIEEVHVVPKLLADLLLEVLTLEDFDRQPVSLNSLPADSRKLLCHLFHCYNISAGIDVFA